MPLSDYTLLHRLSTGGTPTEVWRALAPGGETVVLKRVRPEFAGAEDVVHRLRAEGELLMALGGRRHLLRCDLVLDDPPALVLEYVEGTTLRRRIHPDGPEGAALPVPLNEALRIASAVADGLGHLHAHGVIHRDVKSSNVLLGDGGELRLVDLSVAAWGTPPRSLPERWIEEEVGTLGYAAPELLRYPSAASPALDVYGLGVLVYEALTGRLPYMLEGGEDDRALRWRILAGAAPAPIGTLGTFPLPVERAIMRAIAWEPDRRFATVAEFTTSLSS